MKTSLLICGTLLAASITMAQTPPTNPSSASSPHQRDTTSTTTKETPAASSTQPSTASSPHQKQVTKAIDECITKRQAETASLSKEDAKKACEADMKKKPTQ